MPRHHAAADHHHEDGLGGRVGFILGELGNHPEPGRNELLRPVARFAGLPCGDQPAGLDRRGDRPRVGVADHLDELPGAGDLALEPAARPFPDVAVDARHACVRRNRVRTELGRHHVAGLAAELDGLHVFHRPIRGLGSDDDVDEGDAAEESDQSPHGDLPVDDVLGEPTAGPPAREKDPHRDHRQAGHEDDGDDEEDHDADVGIVDVSAQVQRQHEQPGDESGEGQPHSQQAQPVARDQHQERAIAQPVGGRWWSGSVFHRASLPCRCRRAAPRAREPNLPPRLFTRPDRRVARRPGSRLESGMLSARRWLSRSGTVYAGCVFCRLRSSRAGAVSREWVL